MQDLHSDRVVHQCSDQHTGTGKGLVMEAKSIGGVAEALFAVHFRAGVTR